MINKMKITDTYLPITTLSINGLGSLIIRHRVAEGEKMKRANYMLSIRNLV